eukprot:765439-Hanusia_phi.AAC.1
MQGEPVSSRAGTCLPLLLGENTSSSSALSKSSPILMELIDSEYVLVLIDGVVLICPTVLPFTNPPSCSSAAVLVAMNANLGGRPAALLSTASRAVKPSRAGLGRGFPLTSCCF